MTADVQESLLPALREDLQVLKGGLTYSGAPSWVVLDPVRNRFFSITFEMFQLLSLWNRHRTARSLTAAVRLAYGRDVESEEIEAVLTLLDRSFFFERPISGSWRDLYQRAQHRHSWFMRILHNYLFFKIPLVRPEPFIRAAWPYVSFLFSRGFLLFSALVGCLGLYLVSRQWDAFINTFPYIFSLEGAVVSVVSVALIKSLHELGHAFVAYRYGCRVPTMGIAFMLMVPLLYTDVTDAWRLRSRRSRFLIDAAGILTELSAGAFAVALWVFLPDGPIRSAAFVLATAGWILSLLINLNPFMRFDGYYMFADLIGLDNLQPRAFAHLRWRIRRLFFDIDHEAPERFPPRLDLIVTLYAICTTIYRLLLYLGIALLVYHFTVKIVGILLFIVEIGFFIVRPVWSELRQWWHLRGEIMQRRRTYVSLSILAAAILLTLMPLSWNVRAPALLMPQTFVRLFPNEASRVEHVAAANGQIVQEGEVLFTLASPALDEEMKQTSMQIALAERRLARIGASSGDLAERGVLESELRSLRAKQQGLEERKARLTIRAPFKGRVHDLNPEVFPGRWVARNEGLAFLSSETGIVARGYVSDSDHARLQSGTSGVFIPNSLAIAKSDATLTSVALSAVDRIDLPQLSSPHGGAVAATPAPDGTLVPDSAQYALVATVEGEHGGLTQTVPGVLVLEGSPQSLAASAWRQILKVLIRESGV